MNRPRFDLPIHVWRCLHSGLLDWLIRAPQEIRDSMMIRLDQQIEFPHFLLHVLDDQRLDVFVRVDEADQVQVGICVPVSNGDPWVLFAMSGHHTGLDADWLHDVGAMRLDEELADLLGSSE